MTKEIEKYWNQTSKKYQDNSNISTSSAHYGPFAPNEDKLKLLGNIKGKKILEIGCGGGQCSIALSKKGANCTGLDISEEQLKFARKLSIKENQNIIFIKKDIQTLKGIKSNTYDVVFSAFAIQYVPNLSMIFREVYRVLKKDGVFVFSFDHPFYSIISPSTLKITQSYNTLKRFEETTTGVDGTKKKFIAYSRKISDTFNSLVNSGFYVERIIEPFDEKTENAWKDNYWKKIYPLKATRMIGPTIIFKVSKLKRK